MKINQVFLLSALLFTAVTTVVIHNLPTAIMLTGDTIICHGTSAAVKFQLAGTGPFQIDYTDGFSFFTATNIWGPVGTVREYGSYKVIWTKSII